jgi:hypothetical protein
MALNYVAARTENDIGHMTKKRFKNNALGDEVKE